MNEKNMTPEQALQHYGVKGMRWGQRKATIQKARVATGKHERALGKAEQEYLRARNSGKKKATDKALADLNDKFKKREANRLTAATLTRGEQVSSAILGSLIVSPVGAAAFLGARSASTRDSRPLKDYPVKILKNIDPDD